MDRLGVFASMAGNPTTFTITRTKGPPRIRPAGAAGFQVRCDHVAVPPPLSFEERLRKAWRIIRGEER